MKDWKIKVNSVLQLTPGHVCFLSKVLRDAPAEGAGLLCRSLPCGALSCSDKLHLTPRCRRSRATRSSANMTLAMTLWKAVVNVLCLPLHLMHAMGLYNIYKRIFPMCQSSFSIAYNTKMHEQKKELFGSLTQFTKPGGRLTLLEIGCGSGTNFQYYPPGCKVICTDPNPHFEKYLSKTMADNDHLSYERFVVATGEDLGSVGHESVDVVVCTLVLCSVNDIPQTLREVHRILRPGGAFYFMEHVVADPSTWSYFFQHVLQPLWYYFGDGCEVIRETWKHLEAAGFSDLKLRHIQAPLVFMLKPHIVGYGVK
uniref:Methyltransferase type 11 domain-containing protein n=2 Tax=Amphiprion ocellaris TaxID=80972 RepID=A0A3Q1ANM5_AMPOC